MESILQYIHDITLLGLNMGDRYAAIHRKKYSFPLSNH